jgi:hypothetical protein
MDQLTWLQQSLQKPRLSALARELAGIFPRPGIPRVEIGALGAPQGTYNSASKKPEDHLEYPGHILRYREFSSSTDSISYGWARPYQDHIGVLGGQVTVANDGFFVGTSDYRPGVISTLSYREPSPGWSHAVTPGSGYLTGTLYACNFASLAPVLSGLKVSADGGPLLDADGTILLTRPLSWEPPEARGFTSVQWLTNAETRRN